MRLNSIESLGWNSFGCTILLNFDDKRIRLDAGLYCKEEVDILYITHRHADHINNLGGAKYKQLIEKSDIYCSHCNTDGSTCGTYGYFIDNQGSIH